MASVDDRIVAMHFDNGAFEQKIATTMSSLDKLKSSLDFANSKRGLDDLSTAGKNFSLQGMATSLEGIGSKFSAMGAIAFTVLQNVANRAVDVGISIVKSLSLDQVLGGFHEYETNMNAIQTVLANTKSDGTTLDQVNAALDQLNTYSDKTIYNFSEMARNIGTFTAAGVNLDTSVSAIKGIANLAAVSGSNADQASTAMYQLSQAISTGSVKLMDWNSVVNAGMGGEVFQKALFETGKQMKTIKDVPMKETFEEWTAGGNSFRSTLEKGWLTADVLTNTLQTFTGDLTDAQLLSMGYNADQVKQIQEFAVIAQDAATKVKTFSQLVGTVKESIGSGWTRTFQILFGTFDEAKDLFTGINDAIGKVVTTSADARNNLLQGWKDLGGRTLLIQSLTDAVHGLASIMKPIKEAFREIFPPMTAERLMALTQSFHDLVQKLTLAPTTADAVKRAFAGLFAAFSIGWAVVKGIVGVFGDLFDRFKSESGGGVLGWLANLGDKVVELKTKLVDGGGIADFFTNLATSIGDFAVKAIAKFTEFKDKIIEIIDYFKVGLSGMGTNEGSGILLFANQLGTALRDAKAWVVDFVSTAGTKFDEIKNKIEEVKGKVSGLFGGDSSTDVDKTTSAFGRLGDRFGWLGGLGHVLGAVWDALSSKFGSIRTALGNFVSFIKDKFSGLPQTIADALSTGDYNAVLDTINVGLFGGLLLLINGFTSKFGGVFKSISGSFGQLSGVLKAMQTDIKADALMKIAEAVGLLTISMVVLSLIDSEMLTKSLVAMGVGLGELVGVMTLLNQIISGPTDAAKLTLLAGSLILMAGALLILSLAMKIFSTMDNEGIAKGLTAIVVLLGALSGAVKLMDDTSGMITTGLGIIAIAVALNILALAVKSFAEMSWSDMAKGMAGVAVGLLLITAAVKQIKPFGMIAKGVGLIAIAVALNIIALAVKSFAEMKWADMAKGMTGVAAALLIITVALHYMPNGASLALQGAGLLMIGAGLVAMAQAIQILGNMSWGEMARGLVGLAGALIILAIAGDAMSESLPGALAMFVMSLALKGLADGVQAFAGIKWGDLLHGLIALAATMAVLGIAGYALEAAVPGLLGFGLALILIGAGFALFGIGASAVATAFALIATSGTQGVAVLEKALESLIKHLPAFIAALADGIIQLAKKVLEALPGLIAGLSESLQALFQLIIDNIPIFGETLLTLLHEGLRILREAFPDVVATGLAMLIALLTGVRDNIAEITTLVVDIITNFLDALALKVPEIIDSVYNLVIAIVEGVVEKLSGLASFLLPKGLELLQGLWDGIKTGAVAVLDWFTALPGNILTWIGDLLTWLAQKGIDLLTGMLSGIVSAAIAVTNWFLALPGLILGWIGEVATWLVQKGIDFITGLYNGLVDTLVSVTNLITAIPGQMLDWLGNALNWLYQKGSEFIAGLYSGIVDTLESVWNVIKSVPGRILGFFEGIIDWLVQAGKDLVQGFVNGIKSLAQSAANAAATVGEGIMHAFLAPFGLGGPSRITKDAGVFLLQGLTMGLSNNKSVMKSATEAGTGIISALQDSLTTTSLGDGITTALQNSLSQIPTILEGLDEFNPTITPVLDLTNVERNAKQLSSMLDTSVAYGQAIAVAAASRAAEDNSTNTSPSTPPVINFEQNNYSPEALSTVDIYRQTRNQIAMAKEELAVL